MEDRTCIIEGCGTEHYGRGWCMRHWQRWRSHGDPLFTVKPHNPPPPDGLCTLDGCDSPHSARGFCVKHWKRWRKYGDPHGGRIFPTAWDRFWPKVDVGHPLGCWEWAGAMYSTGYGAFRFEGRTTGAHRVSWMLVHGPIADGFHVDHLCRNTRCVNPDHLEPVAPRENLRRAPNSVGKQNLRKTHCPQGHPYDDVNTKWTKDGRRDCRACHRSRLAVTSVTETGSAS